VGTSLLLGNLFAFGGILATNSFGYGFLFLAVYGVDAICTIIHRLYLKQEYI
jgi:UDP-N-acetylmuramyl pentapeptide phosphotransferase/UDP-N-acetylglucosamine-1-phosphate transferase